MTTLLIIIAIWLAINIAFVAWRLCCARRPADHDAQIIDLANYRRGRAV